MRRDIFLFIFCCMLTPIIENSFAESLTSSKDVFWLTKKTLNKYQLYIACIGSNLKDNNSLVGVNMFFKQTFKSLILCKEKNVSFDEF